MADPKLAPRYRMEMARRVRAALDANPALSITDLRKVTGASTEMACEMRMRWRRERAALQPAESRA